MISGVTYGGGMMRKMGWFATGFRETSLHAEAAFSVSCRMAALARSRNSRADALTVLGDFQGGPVKFRQGGDQAGNHAGFPYAARVSADDDEGHGIGRWSLVLGRWSLVVGRQSSAIVVGRWLSAFGSRRRLRL